jgi:hypothetical protein
VSAAVGSFGDDSLFALIWTAVCSRAADLMRTDAAHSADQHAPPVYPDVRAVQKLLADVVM